MIDSSTLEVGVLVWTKGRNEFGDGARSGMVVDFGVDPDKGEYVIVLDGAPEYPKSSPQRSRWVYSRNDRGAHANHGQVAELRRLYVSGLQPCDGFRDRKQMCEYAARALVAAGLKRGEWGEDHAELDAAAHSLLGAAEETRGRSKYHDEEDE